MVVLAYLVAIVAANLAITAFGPPAAIPVAFLLIGFDFSARDALQARWEGGNLWPRLVVLIAVGGLLSYLVNASAAQIALASTVSFVLAGAIDAVVFALIGKRTGRFLRWNGTNLVGAGIDSILFPTIAFGAFLPAIVIGQYTAKVAGGLLWSVLLIRLMPAHATT